MHIVQDYLDNNNIFPSLQDGSQRSVQSMGLFNDFVHYYSVPGTVNCRFNPKLQQQPDRQSPQPSSSEQSDGASENRPVEHWSGVGDSGRAAFSNLIDANLMVNFWSSAIMRKGQQQRLLVGH